MKNKRAPNTTVKAKIIEIHAIEGI